MRYNFAIDSFYIMKLCSRLFVLYCRSRPKDDRSRHFYPNFEEVRGSVEPWWMARWKARAEFLLSVIELLFLSLTVEVLQGKMSKLAAFRSGFVTWSQNFKGKGRPWGIFFGFYKTRHIFLSNGAKCTVLRAVVFTQYWRVTDRRNSNYSACNASIARCKNGTKNILAFSP